MLIFSKLKSNLWPKHDKLVRILELIHHAKINGGDPKKYSLEYRLQNEQDEFFVDTYKAVIVRALQPKRPGSNPHANSQAYESPLRKNFISRKMNTASNQRRRNLESSNNGSLTRSRNIEHYYSRDRDRGDRGVRPHSKRGRKNESDYAYNADDDLLMKNDSFDPIIININEKKTSPTYQNRRKLALNK